MEIENKNEKIFITKKSICRTVYPSKCTTGEGALVFLSDFGIDKLCFLVNLLTLIVKRAEPSYEKYLTHRVWLLFVNNNPRYLWLVPEKFRTSDFFETAVKKNPDILLYIDNKYKTLNIYKCAIFNSKNKYKFLFNYIIKRTEQIIFEKRVELRVFLIGIKRNWKLLNNGKGNESVT